MLSRVDKKRGKEMNKKELYKDEIIKNIIFDLGNVILKDKPSIVLKKMKLNEIMYNSIKSNFFSNWDKLDLGKISLEEHFNKCEFPFEIDDKVKYQLLNYYKFRPFNTEVIDIINRLKLNNYNIYVLSNNNKNAMKYLMNLPLLKSVDGWIASCDYHILKPNAELYQILFEKYNLNPKECFFIDDNNENINTGKRLGMNGYVLNLNNSGISGLLNKFKEININID